jgi:hypothetical protein
VLATLPTQMTGRLLWLAAIDIGGWYARCRTRKSSPVRLRVGGGQPLTGTNRTPQHQKRELSCMESRRHPRIAFSSRLQAIGPGSATSLAALVPELASSHRRSNAESR